MKLAQRVAVITGAAQGIGAACARLFAEQGAKVVIADINETSGSALADEIVRGGGTATIPANRCRCTKRLHSAYRARNCAIRTNRHPCQQRRHCSRR